MTTKIDDCPAAIWGVIFLLSELRRQQCKDSYGTGAGSMILPSGTAAR